MTRSAVPAPVSPDPIASWEQTLRGALLAFGLAALATLAAATPVVLSPHTQMSGNEITGRHHVPFTVMESFRDRPGLGPYSQPATDLPGAALAWLLGPVAAFNILVLLSYPLTAATSYALARRTGAGHGPSLLAAAIYTWAPIHLAHGVYHVHIAQTQWLPLYLLALWSSLERASWRRLGALAVATALVSLSNWYAGFIAAVLTPVAIAAYRLWVGGDRRAVLRTTGFLLGLAAVALGLAAWRFPGLFSPTSPFAFPRADTFLYSARWWSYLLPAADHPLLGDAVRRFWAERGAGSELLEQQIGLGWGWLMLAAAGVRAWWRSSRGRGAAGWVPVFVALAAAALVCSLSPERAIGPVTTIRPSWLLYELAPMFRAYARFGFPLCLMVALLAARGFSGLWSSRSPRARAAALLLTALGTFEYAPLPWRHRDVLPTRGHRLLAEKSGEIRVLDCVPMRLEDAALSWLFPHPLETLGSRFSDCGEPGLADRLAAGGFTHLLLRETEGPLAERLRRQAGLSLAAELPDSAVFRVTAPIPALQVTAVRGLGLREYDAERSWRWSSGLVAWTVVSRTPRTTASLEVELAAWPHPRRVSVHVDGEPAPDLEVGTAPARYTIGPLALRAAASQILLRAEGVPVVADTLAHNGDRRPLSLAVGDWRWTNVAPPPATRSP